MRTSQDRRGRSGRSIGVSTIRWWLYTRSTMADYALIGGERPPVDRWWAGYADRTDDMAPWMVLEIEADGRWRQYLGVGSSSRADARGRLVRNCLLFDGTRSDQEMLQAVLQDYLSPSCPLQARIDQLCTSDAADRWMRELESGNEAPLNVEEIAEFTAALFDSKPTTPNESIEVGGPGLFEIGAAGLGLQDDVESGALGRPDGKTAAGVVAFVSAAFDQTRPARVGHVSYAMSAEDAAERTAPERRPGPDGMELWLTRGGPDSLVHRRRAQPKRRASSTANAATEDGVPPPAYPTKPGGRQNKTTSGRPRDMTWTWILVVAALLALLLGTSICKSTPEKQEPARTSTP